MKDSYAYEFCNKHRIKLLDANKRAHKITKVNATYFSDPTNYDKVLFDQSFETEPLLTFEISESELEKIANFEAEVFNHMRQEGHYRLFEILMEQKDREKLLRDTYPAVKKAYEQYSLMLKLAGSGEL